ncbi:MAG: hypothetical protein ACMXYG_00590 [Candidatus Woesearchaeota archaeon]
MRRVNINEPIIDCALPGVKAGNPFVDIFYKDEDIIPNRRVKLCLDDIKKKFIDIGIVYPKTKLEDLFYYFSAIKEQENTYYARIEAGINSKSVESHLRKRILAINQSYEGCLYPQDLYLFPDLDKMSKFLVSLDYFDNSRINRDINHEQNHADSIVNLKYVVSGFKCWLCVDDNLLPEYVLSVSMKVKRMISYKDYSIISKANGDNSSCIDRLCI